MMSNYSPYEDRVKPAHCLAECVFCGEVHEKKHMVCLMLRDNCWATPKVVCHMCTECKSNLYERLEIKE